MKKQAARVGFVGVLIKDRKKAAAEVNKILSDFGDSIIARTGVPYREKNLSVITLVVDSTPDEVGSLTGRLGAVPGVSVKSAFSKS